MKRFNFEIFGGRAFLLALGCGVVTSIMRWFGHLDDHTYGIIISVSVGTYIGKSAVDEHSRQRAAVQKSIAAQQSQAQPPNIIQQVKE